MQTKRKEETCGEQLRRNCRSIAMDITNPDHDQTAHDWMEGVYDIRYISRWRAIDLGQHLDERSRRILGRGSCYVVFSGQHWSRRLQRRNV